MSIQFEFDFGQRGSVVANLNMQRLLQMVADTHVPAAKISRSIAFEITQVIVRMIDDGPHLSYLSRHHRDQIAGCRQLQRALMESEAVSKREVLDLDGPAYRFIFGAIVNLLETALLDAGIDPALMQRIMLHFSDLVRENDAMARLGLAKIETHLIVPMGQI